MNKFFKDGQTVLFQGDSITDAQRNFNDCNDLGIGYPKMVKNIYDNLFPTNNIKFINKGVSGNRVLDLLNRYDEDFKAINPDYLSILVGINDVLRVRDNNIGSTTDVFCERYETLLSKIKKDMPNTKIILMEPFVFMTDPKFYFWYEDLYPKILSVRALARKYADYYIPYDGILSAYATCGVSPQELSEDGVHPTVVGHGVMANAYLKTLGIL